MPLFDNAIAYSVRLNRLGTKRKVESTDMEMKAELGQQPDPDALKVSKDILSCDELSAIKTLDGTLKRDLSKLALPSPLAASTYLIPLALVQKVDSIVETFKVERETLVESFVEAYQGACERAKTTLGGLYDPRDYPSLERVRNAFYVETSYLELGTPGSLRGVAPEIFAREQQAFEAQLVSAQEEIRDALRIAMAQLVGHMVEMLTPKADGKPRRFFASNITNITQFLDTFAARNIANDTELAELVDKAKALLAGRTAEEIKQSATVRDSLQSGMAEVAAVLTKMVGDKPGRRFDFSEADTVTVDNKTAQANPDLVQEAQDIAEAGAELMEQEAA